MEYDSTTYYHLICVTAESLKRSPKMWGATTLSDSKSTQATPRHSSHIQDFDQRALEAEHVWLSIVGSSIIIEGLVLNNIPTSYSTPVGSMAPPPNHSQALYSSSGRSHGHQPSQSQSNATASLTHNSNGCAAGTRVLAVLDTSVLATSRPSLLASR
ncbi:hypothetical protein M378DRAFT_16116 [Amanita muscaria Koide BX008]|uniref:Uncharacterized protein n=1 Tax=Amanita muscaria (strain Koide BX008) TaxID=946122 RepID=A0A0C2WN38_AMAMK|nr:hypothetical protein M378DRAFT_16116 [Amanita muscaria Koide BX008]